MEKKAGKKNRVEPRADRPIPLERGNNYKRQRGIGRAANELLLVRKLESVVRFGMQVDLGWQ
jgi:hypothetical protein